VTFEWTIEEVERKIIFHLKVSTRDQAFALKKIFGGASAPPICRPCP
jgi:hypothetical protein